MPKLKSDYMIDILSANVLQFQIRNEDGIRLVQYNFGTVLPLRINVVRSPNIDSMSYEEIMELQERIGTVERGLLEETVSSHLKNRVHPGATTSVDSTAEENTIICTICQEEYENKDIIGTLDCQHEYHADCITQWLTQRNVCPLCRRQGLKAMEENTKIK
ncbi:hypothetical protein MKW94_008397 [Papaver nudicaule]|uniref:RING-type E3 ubiquitin transferase n=1 Tax=Papaver nudicaule TaxID=74823 RepID=A0AA41W058_PAPNU|nr:hypothetical protein [Papaver nudicaule]